MLKFCGNAGLREMGRRGEEHRTHAQSEKEEHDLSEA